MCRFPDPRKLDGSEIAAPGACLYCVHCTATTTVAGVRACDSCARRLDDPEDPPQPPHPGTADGHLAEATRQKITYARKLVRSQGAPRPAERYQPVGRAADGTHGLYDRLAGRVTLTGMTRAERDENLVALNVLAAKTAREEARERAARAVAPQQTEPTPTTTATAGGSAMSASASIQEVRAAVAQYQEAAHTLAGEAAEIGDELASLLGMVMELINTDQGETAGMIYTARNALTRSAEYMNLLAESLGAYQRTLDAVN